MLRVLTPEEELASRRANYERLAPGKLFDLGGNRYFLTVAKSGDSIEVIELEAKNIEHILRGEPCAHSMLHFDGLRCLNVRGPK